MAPAASSRVATVAVLRARVLLRRREPQVLGDPARPRPSFMEKGTPCKRPSGRPLSTSSSARRAASRAASNRSTAIALHSGWTCSRRAMHCSISSTGDICLPRINHASCTALRSSRSVRTCAMPFIRDVPGRGSHLPCQTATSAAPATRHICRTVKGAGAGPQPVPGPARRHRHGAATT